jgi:ABC-2 type transport system ATP-binding protein
MSWRSRSLTLQIMISLEHVTKAYGDYIAVDDVTFDCAPGEITGFLGPNGAGKSTTMRIVVGLTPATRGEVRLNGRRYHDLPNPGRHVGTLLDASAQHVGRSGREILTIGAMTMGLPSSRVDEMLHTVGLTDSESTRQLRNYSLGMKQRLGIAHALLGDPEILILDEPANGLDPAGIRWMRGLLRGYADRGGTVLLSSHLLHEVELVADKMVMIGNGRIVASGDRTALLDLAGGAVTIARAADQHALAAALAAADLPHRDDGTCLHVFADPERVGRAAADHRIALSELRVQHEGLEDVFLTLTAANARESVADLTGAAS